MMLNPSELGLLVTYLSLVGLVILLVGSDVAAGQQEMPPRTPSNTGIYPTPASSSCFLIRFYQKTIAPIGASSCQMHPSCSAYAYQAFQRHGFLRGVVLTADRLMRCNPHAGPQYRLANINGRWRFLDPLEQNTYWWRNPRRRSIARRTY